MIANMFKFIIDSVGLRPGLHPYQAAMDRQNITQMVAQIYPPQGYVQLSALIPITGVAWRIPKSMIFMDIIKKCISISTYLRNGLSSSMAEYPRMVVRPCRASLEVIL